MGDSTGMTSLFHGEQAADHKYRHFFEYAPDAIVIVDDEGRMVDVNAQTEVLFGYDRSDLLARPVEMLTPSRFRRRHSRHREAFFSEPHFRPMGEGLELFGLRKDGTEFPLQISLSVVESDGRMFAGAAIRDVTEQRKIAVALEEKNAELEAASRTKDRFLATMSHELRTPLTAIIGYAGTLLMELPGPLNEQQKDQLSTVRASSKLLLSMINGLLDLARVESGDVELDLERFTCAELLEEVASTLRPTADEKGIRLIVDAGPPGLAVHSDHRSVAQILMNFAANAVKFTEQGTVSLRATTRSDQPGRVIFRVVDTGPGIARDELGRLFEAFERGPETHDVEGTGLGLYISRCLADVIGARITVESEVGDGSTFSLSVAEGTRG